MSLSDDYYFKHYKDVTNKGAVGFVSKIVHYSLENWPYSKIHHNGITPIFDQNEYQILEVGAGHGQHVKYVKTKFTSYFQTDFRPELLEEYANENVITVREPINAEALPYEDEKFDRVIATCLLIHLKEPEAALKEWMRVLKEGGVITVYVPNEPGLVLRLLQATTTRRKQKKLGIPATYLHYKEHPFSYPYLISIIKQNFEKPLIRKFPFIFGPWDLNVWTVITIQK
jgi:ubiquinone/menaquinone biosynthesis C-methylase UbiE